MMCARMHGFGRDNRDFTRPEARPRLYRDLPANCVPPQQPEHGEELYCAWLRGHAHPGRDMRGELLPAWIDLSTDDRQAWRALAVWTIDQCVDRIEAGVGDAYRHHG